MTESLAWTLIIGWPTLGVITVLVEKRLANDQDVTLADLIAGIIVWPLALLIIAFVWTANFKLIRKRE